MDIREELKLENLSKPIDEMNFKEAKAGLKIVKSNIKKLEKAIVKMQSKLAANELKEKIAKDKSVPVVKASNKGDGNLKPVVAAAKPAAKPIAKKK